MGQWRLVFALPFARRLGYEYMLQIDSDSYVAEPLGFNIIKLMAEKGAWMAWRHAVQDWTGVCWGLPELARYHIVAERLHPEFLYENCKPKDISGLFTAESTDAPADQGWNRLVPVGNFLVMNLQFWFRQDVQKFLKLVLSTGGYFRFRWNEQAVMAMVWHMFLNNTNVHQFSFPYEHPGRSAAVLGWCQANAV